LLFFPCSQGKSAAAERGGGIAARVPLHRRRRNAIVELQ
jgi:hypothetical protein